jgi:integrase
VRIPRSKTDQAGEGADVALPRMRGEETCPVGPLEAWLRRAKIRRGPVFRRITAAGTIEGRLTGDGVYKILKARAVVAKLTVAETERLSPHGLRARMITKATLNGALDEQIMPHSRHKDASTMRGYRRRARIVVDNPARLLDLGAAHPPGSAARLRASAHRRAGFLARGPRFTAGFPEHPGLPACGTAKE